MPLDELTEKITFAVATTPIASPFPFVTTEPGVTTPFAIFAGWIAAWIVGGKVACDVLPERKRKELVGSTASERSWKTGAPGAGMAGRRAVSVGFEGAPVVASRANVVIASFPASAT
jgi:hypothetical protein